MSVGPQLSSVSTALDELTDRVTTIAESLSGTERDDVATSLFEVERALRSAGRQLNRVVDDLL
jgi:DNA/RNA-binding domain of Phe-tRNA-synthetase-like protein